MFTLGEGWNATCLHELSPNIGLSSSENISVTISGSEDQSVFGSSDGLFTVKAVNLNIQCKRSAQLKILKTEWEALRNKCSWKLAIMFSDTSVLTLSQCLTHWLTFLWLWDQLNSQKVYKKNLYRNKQRSKNRPLFFINNEWPTVRSRS